MQEVNVILLPSCLYQSPASSRNSLSIHEHIAVCSQYGVSAVSVSTDSVKCSVWSKFEQSVLSDYIRQVNAVNGGIL